MLCPSCGKEIADDHLLCDYCGAEIQIVPDFEPEVENSITETLTGVVNEFVEKNDTEEDNDAHEPEAEEIEEKPHSMILLTIGCIVLFILIIIVIIYSVKGYKNTPRYLYREGNQLYKENHYEEALVVLQQAYENGGNDDQTVLLIADCYHGLGDDENYVRLLLGLIKKEGVSAEIYSQSYEKLIGCYEVWKQYEQINSLLMTCTDQNIVDKYSKYMAKIPEFNYLEGAYNEVIPFKILANTEGHIYFTMDGTTPTEDCAEFKSPIFLDTGDYEITALFVNQYGIHSPLSKVTYHVEVPLPNAPEVDAYSGDFLSPQLIHVQADENCTIYYTTDETEPTEDSMKYNGFLTMPVGKSTFKFIAYDENHVGSEITVRHYNLELLTETTVSDAQNAIYAALLSSGQIVMMDGTISAIDLRRMVYTFALVTTIEEEGDFYIFSEYIQNLDGNLEKTGNYYAVGIYNLPVHPCHYDAATSNFALNIPTASVGEDNSVVINQ